MFIPLGTDRRLKRIPWVNYALIGVNLAIFLLTIGQISQMQQPAPGVIVPRDLLAETFPVLRFYLDPEHPALYQFVTYQFLHGSWMHVLGNMLFLWVFGNAVEDRLGKLGYLAFYLAGGVIAGLGHAMVLPVPILGASGSVAAVTGAYLALFPLSNVTILVWFVIVYVFQISSMVLILFRVIMDAVFHFLEIGNVAYLAHLAGYGFGFAVALGLLLGRILPREPYDLLALIEHRRRRSAFRKMTGRGYQPWDAPARPDATLPPGITAGKPISPEQQRIMDKRAAISDAMTHNDMPAAARHYLELLELSPEHVLNEHAQLDVANQLMAESRYDHAARAYELFLSQYPGYMQKEQVQLILGLIYARYLKQGDRARELLQAARQRLHGSNRELADEVLAELKQP